MAATTAVDLLEASANAILEEVAKQDNNAKTADVIRAVSAKHPPAVVREAYWQLISENRLARAVDGRLSRRPVAPES